MSAPEQNIAQPGAGAGAPAAAGQQDFLDKGMIPLNLNAD